MLIRQTPVPEVTRAERIKKMARKLSEYTGGNYIYMKLQIDNGIVAEISAYILDSGWKYRTSVDNDPALREEIINAFNELY